jgi:hypothetical protein
MHTCWKPVIVVFVMVRVVFVMVRVVFCYGVSGFCYGASGFVQQMIRETEGTEGRKPLV